VEQSENVLVRSLLSEWHLNECYKSYFENDDLETALAHVRIAGRYDPQSFSAANNLGYLCLTNGRLGEARLNLERAVTLARSRAQEDLKPRSSRARPRQNHLALALCNLGVVAAKEGDTGGALSLFQDAAEEARSLSEEEGIVGSLWLPVLKADGQVEFTELRGCQLLDTALQAIDNLSPAA